MMDSLSPPGPRSTWLVVTTILFFATAVFAQQENFHQFTRPSKATNGARIPAGSTYQITWIADSVMYPGTVVFLLDGGYTTGSLKTTRTIGSKSPLGLGAPGEGQVLIRCRLQVLTPSLPSSTGTSTRRWAPCPSIASACTGRKILSSSRSRSRLKSCQWPLARHRFLAPAPPPVPPSSLPRPWHSTRRRRHLHRLGWLGTRSRASHRTRARARSRLRRRWLWESCWAWLCWQGWDGSGGGGRRINRRR
ncbi:hypothetical protein QBC39DRAFT_112548 [Podospora conica]|nr:hypothetical protein QBC39DRAFT_112548 [Schizothecium conicum]